MVIESMQSCTREEAQERTRRESTRPYDRAARTEMSGGLVMSKPVRSRFSLGEFNFRLLCFGLLALWKETLCPDDRPDEQEHAENAYNEERDIFTHVRLLSIQIPNMSKMNARTTVANDQ